MHGNAGCAKRADRPRSPCLRKRAHEQGNERGGGEKKKSRGPHCSSGGGGSSRTAAAAAAQPQQEQQQEQQRTRDDGAAGYARGLAKVAVDMHNPFDARGRLERVHVLRVVAQQL